MDIRQLVVSISETVLKIVVAVFVIMFVYDASVKAYDYGYRVFAETPVTLGDGRTISIYVKEEDSVKDIGKSLEEKGLIRDANLFVVQELVSEYHGKINPGIYDLNTSMSAEEMLSIMAAGAEDTDTGADEETNEGVYGDGDSDGDIDTDVSGEDSADIDTEDAGGNGYTEAENGN